MNKRILTWGDAGVGKTTFCSKLAQDWAEIVKGTENTDKDKEKLSEEQRHLLSNIGIVLYIVFRDTHETESLGDIVKSQIFDKISEGYKGINVSDHKYHNDILLVCDGLDEVSYEECELFEIIAGRMYPNVKSIVTCRPNASWDMSLTADAEIRLKGFSKEQARHYVDMYFRQKHTSNTKLADQESNKLWCEIESSPDLQEMAINPSMLQLLCKLFFLNGRIARDRATIFKDYTNYLLQHYHNKLHTKTISQSELNAQYKDTLLKAGNIALQGLKQNHLQLIFNRETVENIAGKEMFDIGFVTEVPNYGSETSKAQFIHKTHQEYLAAYFIVNSPEKVGLDYLMEFCSTSKALMGSQMILIFITAMSTKMGQIVQKQIQEFVASLESQDGISPKGRTSFLLAMLKENRSLVFPLPKEIDINIPEFETNIGWVQWFGQYFGWIQWFGKYFGWIQWFWQYFAKKNALEYFFDLDNRGVQKISIVLGEKYRLQLLNKFQNNSICELVISFQRKMSQDDLEQLNNLFKFNKKLQIISMTKLDSQGASLFFKNIAIMSSLEALNQIQIFQIHDSQIDPEIADAFKTFPSHIELDMSGNRITDQTGFHILILETRHLLSVKMQCCSIIIDAEIAEAISQLPEKANLDLSGNTVTKMDSSLLCHVIPVVSNKKIDLSGLGVVIDGKVAQEIICSLDKQIEVDISDNIMTHMDYEILYQLLYKLYRKTNADVQTKSKVIKTRLLEVIQMKHNNMHFDITDNDIFKQDIILSMFITSNKWEHLIVQDNKEALPSQKTTDIPEHLYGNVLLDIHDSDVPRMRNHILPLVISCMANQEKVDLSQVLFSNIADLEEPLLSLPDHVQLDLSSHHIGNNSTCMGLIKKSGNLSSLVMQDCGIIIDTEIAEVISQLPEQSNLDLSGNTVTKMDSSLLCHVIPVISNKKIDLSGLGVVIDGKVAQAIICSLDKQIEVDISDNIMTHMDCKILFQLLYKLYRKTDADVKTKSKFINTQLLEVIQMKHNNMHFDITDNDIFKQDIILSMFITANKWEHLIVQDNKETLPSQKTTDIPDHLYGNVLLDIHDSDVPRMRNHILPLVISCMANQEKVDLSQVLFSNIADLEEPLLSLPDHVQLDLSSHHIGNNCTCMELIKKSGNLSSLVMQDCGIIIDTEVAEAISQLPEQANLDLSGNTVTKMDSSLLCHVIPVISNRRIDLSGLGICIDENVAQSLCSLEKEVEVDISDNFITNMDYQLLCKLLYRTYRKVDVVIYKKERKIKCTLLQVIYMKQKGTQFDISNNDILQQDVILSLIITAEKWRPLCQEDNSNTAIKDNVMRLAFFLQGDVQLDIQNAKVPLMKNTILGLVTFCMSNQELVNLSDILFNKSNDTIGPLLSLPSNVQLDMSGHTDTSKSTIVTLILKAASLKSLKMQDCGIIIDTEIAEAISHLPEHANLDLSGNTITKMDSSLLCHVIPVMSNKKIDLSGLGVVIDGKVAQALCSLKKNSDVEISDNIITKMEYNNLCQVLYILYRNTVAHIKKERTHIKTPLLQAFYLKQNDTHFDITNNNTLNQDIVLSMFITANKWEHLIVQDNKEALLNQTKTDISKQMHGKVLLDIHDPDVPRMRNHILPLVISCMANQEKVDLSQVLFSNTADLEEPLLSLPDHVQLDLSSHHMENNSTCMGLIKKSGTLSALRMQDCGIIIDKEIAEAISQLPEQANLDLSGNTVTKMDSSLLCHVIPVISHKKIDLSGLGVVIDDKVAQALHSLNIKVEVDLSGNMIKDESVCITLICAAPNMKSFSLCNCGIQIDTEVGEAISQLPEQANLDLSGNTVTKMDSSLLCHVIPVISNRRIDLSGLGICIDENVAQSLCSLEKEVEVDISDNSITNMDYQLLCKLLYRTYRNVDVVIYKKERKIKSTLLQVIYMKQKGTQFDISNNDILQQDIMLSLIITAEKWRPLFQQDNSNTMMKHNVSRLGYHLQGYVHLDLKNAHFPQMRNPILEIVTACVSNQEKVDLSEIQFSKNKNIEQSILSLPDNSNLDLSGHIIGRESTCIKLIKKAGTLSALRMQDCGIIIDTEIAEAISQLPEQANLDLSGNTVTKMDSSLLCHVIPVISNKKIDLSGLGVIIDAKVAQAINSLDDNVEVDLSGNKAADNSACAALLRKATTMKYFNVNCMSYSGLQIDTHIAEAVSRLPDYTQLNLSGNQVIDKSASITLIHKAATMKSLSICNCGILIDTEVAEAISRLPEQANLDLSGNTVTKMDSSLLCHVIPVISHKKIDLSGLGVVIDTKVAATLCTLNKQMKVDLSGNYIADKSACIALIRNAYNIKSLSLSQCGTQINKAIARVISMLPDDTQLDLSGNHVIHKSACITLLHKAATMKALNIHNCISNSGIQIDTGIAEAVSMLPDHTQLDLSGNQVIDKSASITLIHKAATMKSLSLCNCGIQIDTEIAVAISQLPEQANLDMSGNTVTKMDSSLLCHVIPVISNKKIDLSGLGVVIDDKVAQVLCAIGKEVEVDLTGNQITDKSTCISLIQKVGKNKSLSMCDTGIIIDTEIAEAVSQLPEQANLDLSGNTVTKMDSSLLCHVIPVISNKKIDLSGLGFVIDCKVAQALFSLNKKVEVHLSFNKITDKSACITLILKAATMKSLSIGDCGIQIDTEIAETVSRLPDDTQLDLSGNQVTDKSACITLIHKAASMKSLSLCNCGITIDSEIAEAISQLPEEANLDLSGNTVTKMDSSLLCHVIPVIRHKKIDLSGLGLVIDAKVAETLCSRNEELHIDLTGNDITPMDPYFLCRILTYMKKNEKIDMDKWGITVDVNIINAMSKLPELKYLIISISNTRNTLTAEAASELPQTVSYLTQLQWLYLDGCSIGSDDVVALTNSLWKHCALLEVLSLSYNDLSSGMNEVVNHIQQMKRLKSLYLDKCGISNCLMVALTDHLHKKCPLLEWLSLRSNHLSIGVWAVLEEIQQMTYLKRLYLDKNPCMDDKTQRDEIKTKLQKTNPDLDVRI